MGVGREGGSGQSEGKMSQVNHGSVSKRNKEVCKKLLALVTNWALLYLFPISSCSREPEPKQGYRQRTQEATDSKNEDGPVLLAPD